MTHTALIIDTETDQGSDPRPIQVATINVATGFEWMKYFNSGRSISPVVIKVHGITDEDVAGLECFKLEKFELSEYLIGHNVRFDWRVIGRPSTKLICTVRLAREAFPEWRYYGQSKCIEQLIGQSAARQMTAAAHDAHACAICSIKLAASALILHRLILLRRIRFPIPLSLCARCLSVSIRASSLKTCPSAMQNGCWLVSITCSRHCIRL
nr:3'-5' exonuclease [Psychrobacter coccoides]